MEFSPVYGGLEQNPERLDPRTKGKNLHALIWLNSTTCTSKIGSMAMVPTEVTATEVCLQTPNYTQQPNAQKEYFFRVLIFRLWHKETKTSQ